MKSEDGLKDILKVIKSRASSDFSCMHPMSKDDFIQEYSSEVMNEVFKYYEEQYEVAREKYQDWRDSHYGG